MSHFNLRVLKSAAKAHSPEDLLRLAIHAEEIYECAPNEKESLDFGLAIFSKDHARLNGANQIRDVSIPADMTPQQMIEQADDFFRARNLTCRQWIFSDARVPQIFSDLLVPRGFVRKKSNLHRLESPGDFSTARSDLTIIPGRASFAKLQELTESAERTWGTTSEESITQYKSTAIRALDDPQVDNLLVLEGSTPVATAYLITAGECGLIGDLYVHPQHTRKHIATTLMERLIELAARSRLRHLLLFCDDDNAAAQSLYEKSGFLKIRPCECMELPALDCDPVASASS